MTGQAHWVVMIGVIGMAGVLGVICLFVLRRSYFVRLYVGQITCPRTGEVADVVVVRDTRNGQWIGIRRCTASARPDVVTCDRTCMRHPRAVDGSKLVPYGQPI